MKFSGDDLLLYAVTDSRWCTDESLAKKVEKALKGGVTIVQLREKNLDDESFTSLALEIKEITDAYSVPLIINDRVEIASKIGASGVHVGQKDMKPEKIRKILGDEMIIGVTAKTVEQALEAEKSGADYLGVGAFFGSRTKQDALSIDRNLAGKIIESVEIPIVGIGGITLENAPSLEGLGLDGIAVVSSIFKSRDIINDTEKLLDAAKIVRGAR